MNVEEWSEYHKLKLYEKITEYKGLPSIERLLEDTRQIIIYPDPMIREITERLPACKILHASHEVFDSSGEEMHCQEKVELDVDFGTYQYYCNLDVRHFEYDRAIEFDYSTAITAGMYPSSEVQSALLQHVFEQLRSHVMTHSPYRLDMITNQYETSLPTGVEKL